MDSFAYYVHSPYSFNGPMFVPWLGNETRGDMGTYHPIRSTAYNEQRSQEAFPVQPLSCTPSNGKPSPRVSTATPMPAQRPTPHVLVDVPSVCTTPFPRQTSSDDFSMFDGLTPSCESLNSPSVQCSPTYLPITGGAANSGKANSMDKPAQPQSTVYLPPTRAASRALALSLIPSRMAPSNTTTTTLTTPQPLAEIIRAAPQQLPTKVMAIKSASFSAVGNQSTGFDRTVSTDSSSMASEVSVLSDSPQSLQKTAQTTEADPAARPLEKPDQSNNIRLTTPGCCHKKDWKRLRSKKGLGHYRCELCGARWKKVAGSARCGASTSNTTSSNTSDVEGEESD